MDAKKCDVCSKFYVAYPAPLDSMALFPEDYGINSGVRIDLCGECMLEILDLMERRGFIPVKDGQISRTIKFLNERKGGEEG